MRTVKILQQKMQSTLAEIHYARVKAVFWAVQCLLLGQKLALTALGRSARGDVYIKHSIKRIDRLLGNSKLHRETNTFYRAVASFLIGTNRRPVIVIDWTGVGQKHSGLVAGVPLDGRCIPLYCRVYSRRKNNNPTIQRRFLASLRSILPAECRPIIVTDAGFHNDWFRDVVRWEWDFVGRVISNAKARDPERSKWFSVLDLYKKATGKARDLGPYIMAKANPCCLRMVVYKKKYQGKKQYGANSKPAKEARKRERQPWLLATSLADAPAKEVVNIYAKRMQIEETFRDAKNQRFGFCFREARSSSKQRLEVLLLIATIGMLALTIIGQHAEATNLHRKLQANTVTTKRVLSLFYLGRNLILIGQDEWISTKQISRSIEIIKEKLPTITNSNYSLLLGIS